MKKSNFLADEDVSGFVSWFADIIAGSVQLNFRHRRGRDRSLVEAFQRYSWPTRLTPIPTSNGPISLPKGASFAVNQEVLGFIATNLRAAIGKGTPSDELFDAMQAVLGWGGVYSSRGTKGNKGWLKDLRCDPKRAEEWISSMKLLRDADDDEVGRKIRSPRSNAGTTKIHSLIFENWIIYDSRVAAALAWLVYVWSQRRPPSILQFGCMGALPTGTAKIRIPDRNFFKVLRYSDHHGHLQWNLRANWLLREAVNRVETRRKLPFTSLREIEAALFVMGEDLTYALATD